MMNHFYNHMGGMHFWWWVIGSIIIAFVFVTLLFFYLKPSKNEEPLEILKRRFAKGEISQEEFESAKKVLDS
ncbi:SHOCT domain-containing protein [Gaetbulibacter aestuarii]|uniref:SHOCT domain-containing protein n=1 Tax=Gaetbulibacter aestuarii TaxID=1502358 RepID=A0ABW7MYF1_9FLAO